MPGGTGRNNTLPAALRALRKENGWSQETLAEKLGTSRFRVIEWEHGRSHPTPLYRTKLISLGVAADVLGRQSDHREVEKRLSELEGEIAAIRALVQEWS